MTFKVKLKNYGSTIKGKPYVVEARLNGKLIEDATFYRTINNAKKYISEKFIGAEIEEDFNTGKRDETYNAAIEWFKKL